MRPRRLLLLLLIPAAIALGLVLWRWLPPSGGTMAAIRTVDVQFETAWAPHLPEGVFPGRRLTSAQRDALAATIAASLDQSCTAAYRRDLARSGVTPQALADEMSPMIAKLVWPPDQRYQAMRDFQFSHRTWSGALVFDLYETGFAQNHPTTDASQPSQRLRFEKVDGKWLVAGREFL